MTNSGPIPIIAVEHPRCPVLDKESRLLEDVLEFLSALLKLCETSSKVNCCRGPTSVRLPAFDHGSGYCRMSVVEQGRCASKAHTAVNMGLQSVAV